MKNQALFSSKDKSKNLNMSVAIFVWRFKVVICSKYKNLNKITKN